MKIRLLLPALVLIAQVVDGGRFDLPKENPQISIQMPDNWQTALDGDSITAHPANNSKVMKIGKVAEQKQAGITFFGGQGEGEKDGFELTLAVAASTPDGKRFFGLAWSRDDASGDVYIKDIDRALTSIQPFKEVSKPLK